MPAAGRRLPSLVTATMAAGLTLAAVIAAVATTTLGAAPAGAHTALLQASPGPDDIVGGSIDFVDLQFLEPVTEADVTVSYNGAPVAGTTTVRNGEIIRYQFDQPLQSPGRYQVFYEMISFDSDYTTSGFFFTFDLAAEQAARIDFGEEEDGGSSILPIVLAAIGVTVVVALGGAFMWRIDNQRRELIDGGDYGAYDDYDQYDDDGYGYDDYGSDEGYGDERYGGERYDYGDEPRAGEARDDW